MTIDLWQDFFNELTDDNLSSLVREQELGSMNFSDAVNILRVIRNLVVALSQENAEELPSDLPSQVSERVAQIQALIQQMRDFTLAQDQASTQRQNITNQLEDQRQWFARDVRPNLRGRVVEVANQVAEITAAHDRAVAIAREVDDLAKKVRLGAGEVGANKLAAYYENQAESHSKAAQRFFWSLIAAVVLAAVAVFAGFVLVPIPIVTGESSDVRWEEFIRGLVIRLVLLGIGSFVVALLARNYRVNKHLQVVNETKRNALNTFVLFSETAATEETRAVITAELVRAVFLPGDSGYIGEGNEKTIIESAPALTSFLRPQV